MFNTATCLYTIVLFVLLTPGILLRLPPKGSPLVVAIVHGAVFALILCFTHKAVSRLSVDGFGYGMDGFSMCKDNTSPGSDGKCKDGSTPA
jgi:hypothetical protein